MNELKRNGLGRFIRGTKPVCSRDDKGRFIPIPGSIENKVDAILKEKGF